MNKAYRFNLGLPISAIYLSPRFVLRFGIDNQGVYVEAGSWRITIKDNDGTRRGLLFGQLDVEYKSHMYSKTVEDIAAEYFKDAKVVSILVKENPLDVEVIIESPKIEHGYLLVEIYSISGFEVGGLEVEPGYRNWLTSKRIGYFLEKGLPIHEEVNI